MFIFNANGNRFHDNWFEGCRIGIHFTAGSERNRLSGNLAFWYLDGTSQTGGGLMAGEADLAWTVAGAGDFDRDGWIDLLWRHTGNGAVRLWKMRNQNVLEVVPIAGAPTSAPTDEIVAVADFDGDTTLDLLWRRATGDLEAWLLDGTEFVGLATPVPGTLTDPNWRIAGAWDVDDDGWNDVVLQHRVNGRMLVWYMRSLERTCGAYLTPEAPIDPRWGLDGLR